MLMIPLGWFIHYAVYGRIVRHVFVTVAGITIQLILYKSKIIEVMIMGFVSYFIMICLPRHKQAFPVTIFSLGMLFLQHIRTYINDPYGENYEMGVTTYTMLLACKMQALGYNYQDGGDYLKH